ncbi:MAG: hypothetical protein JNL19_16710 [Burkholderiales bacterium]|nr:hypothetical protein [Burkholderiales bacterium]
MNATRDSERTLWRIAHALMGDRNMIWVAAVAWVAAWAGLAYALIWPPYALGRGSVSTQMTAYAASLAFLLIPAVASQVWLQARRHPLFHLAPDGERRLRALSLRLGGLAMLSFIPALVLHGFADALTHAPRGTWVTLGMVDTHVWRAWALYLLAGAGLTLWLGRGLRTPPNLLYGVLNLWALQLNVRYWWITALMALVLVGGFWLYSRFKRDDAPARPPMLGDPMYVFVKPERHSPRRERWRAHRLRRAIRAREDKRAVALALLSDSSATGFSWFSALMLAYFVVVVQPLSLSRWGAASDLFVGVVAMFVAIPRPIGIASLWLLPLGLRQHSSGELIAAVWIRQVRVRIATGVALGMVILAALQMFYPAWLDRWALLYGQRTLADKLLWAPLFLAFVLHGAAYTASVIGALSPRALASRRAPLWTLLAMLLVPVLAGGGLFAANAIAAWGIAGLSAPVAYGVLIGILLPVGAKLALRMRRSAWQRADVAAISEKFADAARRMETATTFEREVRFVRWFAPPNPAARSK